VCSCPAPDEAAALTRYLLAVPFLLIALGVVATQVDGC
jgi:hypothetical protein